MNQNKLGLTCRAVTLSPALPTTSDTVVPLLWSLIMVTSCHPGPFSCCTGNDHRDSYSCIGVVLCNCGDWLASLFSAIAQEVVVSTAQADPDRVFRKYGRGGDERRHGGKSQEYGHKSEFNHGRREFRRKREATIA